MSDPTTPTTPAPATPDANSQPDGNAAGDASPKGGDKLFSQAELDAIVKDRLKRAEEKAATAEAKAKEQAAAKALEEQGEFKKLADERATQLLALETTKAELTAQVESLTEKAGKYEKALNSLLAEHMKSVPENIQTLLKERDPVDQLTWISANAGALKVSGVPMTPKADGKGLTQAQQEAARKSSDRFYRDGF